MGDGVFEKRYLREKAARRSAEHLLEQKTREIFERNSELEQLKTHLELLVEQRTKEAFKASNEAIQANRAKSQFLANMSHEIRTPLTAIIGYAELLRREKMPPELADSHLTTIINNGRHLTELLSEILDLSKIETQNLELENCRFNLPELISELRELHQINAASKDLKMLVDVQGSIPCWIVADPTRLKQVLHNLLSNAIKFTHQGEIRLSVSTVWPENKIVFSVNDTGEGIADEQQEQIFDSFKQADASITRKYGGTGLGLSIARSIITLMGGELTVLSKLGVGSEFTASIVAAQLEGQSTTLPLYSDLKHKADHQDIPHLSGKVLLVEDTLVNQQLIKNNIELTGASVTLAENGEQALSLAMSHDFDLVLMDIQMPVLDGKKALQGLHQLGYQKPVYALTANVMQSDIQEYSALGFSGTLAKPVDFPKLCLILKQYLQPASITKPAPKALPRALSTKIEELKPLFMTHLATQLQQIDAYLQTSEFDNIAKILHVIKGSAGNFGYNSLTEIANSALVAIRTHQLRDVPELVASVVELANDILTRENNRA